jgi:hypothetical protein
MANVEDGNRDILLRCRDQPFRADVMTPLTSLIPGSLMARLLTSSALFQSALQLNFLFVPYVDIYQVFS